LPDDIELVGNDELDVIVCLLNRQRMSQKSIN